MAAIARRYRFGAVLLAAACASAGQDPRFAAALRTVCNMPEVHSAKNVEVVTTTAPVMHLAALRQLLDPSPLTVKDVETLTAVEAQLSGDTPLVIPSRLGCHWRTRASREPYSDALRIEISKIVPAGAASNPEPGVFVRISAGGRPGADIYWLPLVPDAAPIRMDVSDG